VKEPDETAPGPLARAPVRALPLPEWARRLATLLDSAIKIPGTDIRIGLDPILGLVLPELGDALTGTLSLTLLFVAFRERVPKVVIGRMLLNIAIDAIFGAVPLLGDLFDFGFRANQKNLALVERHRRDPSLKPTWGDRLVIASVAVLACALIALPLIVVALIWRWLGSV
jgi:hypothetical protein